MGSRGERSYQKGTFRKGKRNVSVVSIRTMTCVTVNRFRWVACQLDELKKCTKRRKTLNYILESLPKTLEGTYDQILSRIPPADASCAVKLLLWLAFSKQPLHIDYLAVVVEFNLEEKAFDPDARLSSPIDVLKICSTLVTRMGDDTVQLAHASVKKYIQEKTRIIQSNIVMDPCTGDSFISQCCITYLLYSKETHPNQPFLFLKKPNQERYQQSLVRYAAKNWAKHFLQANCDTFVVKQVKRLFIPTSFAFQNWVSVYNYELEPPCPKSDPKYMWSQSPLQCAALHGVTIIVKWLLPSAKQIEELLGAFNTASLHQHSDIVEVLLEEVGRAIEVIAEGGRLGEDAKVSLMRELYGNALQAASYGGHVKIVQILLEKGADVNAQGGPYGNALHGASYKGNSEIVRVLLEQGADVNAQGRYYGNALQAASCQGNNEIVQILLEKGANVNAQGGSYGNALHGASYKGNSEIVRVLLEQGADVNAQGRYYGNALQAASCQGNNEIVQILLEKGANVNAQGGHYGNALQAASWSGHRDIVQLLLEQGANVNVQGGLCGSALVDASSKGHKEIIQLLLSRGADINAQGGKNGDALQVASWSGHKDIVQLLLEQGANVNAQGELYGSALQGASQIGHKEIIQL